VFERHHSDERVAILLNFGRDDQPLRAFIAEKAVTLLSTELDQPTNTQPRALRANEGLVLLLVPD
jgi:hypothetical protein